MNAGRFHAAGRAFVRGLLLTAAFGRGGRQRVGGDHDRGQQLRLHRLSGHLSAHLLRTAAGRRRPAPPSASRPSGWIGRDLGPYGLQLGRAPPSARPVSAAGPASSARARPASPTRRSSSNINASGTDWYDISYVDAIDTPLGLSVSNGELRVSPSTCSNSAITNCPADSAERQRLPQPLHEVQHRPVLLPWRVRHAGDLRRRELVGVGADLREQRPQRLPAQLRVRL